MRGEVRWPHGWHSGRVPRLFSARDRRPLNAVLTAGLKHAQLDQLVADHPIPGDPGHDAGKAGRVGLFTATVLTGADHGLLVQALGLIDPEKIPAGHRADLTRLRCKAGLEAVSAAPALVATDREAAFTSEAEVKEEARACTALPEPEPADLGPVVVLEHLDREHPDVQVIVQALERAGVQVMTGGGQRPAGALVLRPAGAG